MCSNMNQQTEPFDVLPNFEIIGGRQLACANVGGITFIRDLFIHTLWRQRFPHLFLCPCCPPRLVFLRRSNFFAGGLTMSLEGALTNSRSPWSPSQAEVPIQQRAIRSAICFA